MVQKPCLAVGKKLISGCFVFMSVSELFVVLITFSALTDGYRSENWENKKLCGNTTPGQGEYQWGVHFTRAHNFEFSQSLRLLI